MFQFKLMLQELRISDSLVSLSVKLLIDANLYC